jgi:hypothetical protein
MCGTILPIPPYVFMAWYLAKQRTTLLLTQILKLKAKSNLNQL